MLRIDKIENGRSTLLKLEGRIMGAWIDEVRRTCRDAIRRGLPVTLDVSAVSFIDAEGLVLLRELTAGAVVLVNTTPFIDAQLRG